MNDRFQTFRDKVTSLSLNSTFEYENSMGMRNVGKVPLIFNLGIIWLHIKFTLSPVQPLERCIVTY